MKNATIEAIETRILSSDRAVEAGLEAVRRLRELVPLLEEIERERDEFRRLYRINASAHSELGAENERLRSELERARRVVEAARLLAVTAHSVANSARLHSSGIGLNPAGVAKTLDDATRAFTKALREIEPSYGTTPLASAAPAADRTEAPLSESEVDVRNSCPHGGDSWTCGECRPDLVPDAPPRAEAGESRLARGVPVFTAASLYGLMVRFVRDLERECLHESEFRSGKLEAASRLRRLLGLDRKPLKL